jgi:hypothetical protein
MICHGANGTFGDFVSNPDGLIGKTVTGWSATADACKPPALLINGTGAPDGVLFKRIRGDECGTGTRMPMGATEPLAPDLVQCLTEWVTSKLPQASPPEDSALPGEEGDGGA